jgi:hypothetical protein
MQEESRDINEAATEALANAKYRYTFGIVGEGRSGGGSQSLGMCRGLLEGSDGASAGRMGIEKVRPYRSRRWNKICANIRAARA